MKNQKQKNKELKGHIKIQLFDENKNLIEEQEKDNMITNIIYSIIGHCLSTNYNPNLFLPLSTKALGGVILYDEELEEDPDNVFLPMNAKVVGHAGRNVDITTALRGSFNSAESGKTATGYVSTWDFSTAQANGIIKSLGLTHYMVGNNFYQWSNSDYGITLSDMGSYIPIFSDGDILFCLPTSNYTYNTLYKSIIPGPFVKVNDYSYSANVTTVIQTLVPTVSTSSESYSSSNFQLCFDSTQKRLYAITFNRNGTSYGISNNTGDAEIWYYKWHYENGTFVEEPYSQEERRYHATLTGVHAYWDRNAINRKKIEVSNGYLYFYEAAKDSGNYWITLNYVYRVNLSNPAQIAKIDLTTQHSPIRDYSNMKSMVGGGVYISSSSNVYNHLLIYPDGTFKVYDYTNTWQAFEALWGATNCYQSTDGAVWYAQSATGGTYSTNIIRKSLNLCYLGSIINLESPITKTSAQTMKVIYTLTDVDPEEEEEGE